MSEQEAIAKAKPIWWERAKKLIFLSQFIHSLILGVGICYGVYIIVDNKIAEVLATPKRTTALERQDSSKFRQTDSSLIKHNGYFVTLFTKVDTTKKYKQ